MAIPPLDIHLKTMIQNAAIRLNKLAKRSPVIQRLPNKWRHNQQPTSNPPIPTTANSKACKPKTTSLLKLAKRQGHNCEKITTDIPPWTKTANNLGNKIEISHITCPKDKRKETAREHMLSVRSQSNDQSILTIYTDGSKTEEGTGTGFIAYHRNHADTPLAPSPRVDRSRPNRSDVYQSSTQNADATTLRTCKVDDICLHSYCSNARRSRSVPPIIVYTLVLYATYLSLIIFKIIPHPMTLLIAIPLQVIILHLI
jgi:hypothetical protein